MRRETVISILVALLAAMPALAAPSANPSPAPAAASPADDRLKSTFEALPEADRRALQDALLWTGDYAGVITGGLGPRSREALIGFARKNGIAPDAVLDPRTRARLLAAAVAARAAVGFAPVKDKQAGVGLSLPLKLLPRRVSTEGGTHYASADGDVVVDTLSRPAGPQGLPEVFDRMSTAAGTRKVTYKLLKPDFFVVSGEIAERKFYSRFVIGIQDGHSLIRGITLAYPKADAARLDPMALATAASFDAFPSNDAPASAVAAAPAKPPPAPATFALNAVRVDPGMALTHLPAQSCLKPTLGGVPVTLRKADRDSGLALFDLPSVPGSMPVLVPDAARTGAALLALFSHDPEGLNVAPAEVEATGEPTPEVFVVSAGFQGRAEGAPVVDRDGRLAGIVSESRRVPPSVAGTRLESDYPVIAASRLKSFLDEAGVAAAPAQVSPPRTVAAVATAWRPLLLRIICQVAAATP